MSNLLSGPMTGRRFRVVGSIPEGWRETYRSKLEEHAFRALDREMGKEVVEGWVQAHDMLESSFDDYNRWLYNDYAVFALRMDKKTLPGEAFKAHLKRRLDAWCAERGVERCPARHKREIREELEQEWYSTMRAKTALVQCVWSVRENWLLIGTHSEPLLDRIRRRFLRTFGLKLVPESFLDGVSDVELVVDVQATKPTAVPSSDET